MKRNKVKYGLCNTHYATITEDETTGLLTYATPLLIPGPVSLVLSAQGDAVEFYAGNIKYFEKFVNDGYQGTLELALIPEEYRIDCLGEERDVNNMLVENSEARQKHFALLFEFDGDASATRWVLYYCLASRPNIESATRTKNIEVKTESLSISAAPRPDTRDVKANTGDEATKAMYDNWYKSVYQKGAAAPGGGGE